MIIHNLTFVCVFKKFLDSFVLLCLVFPCLSAREIAATAETGCPPLDNPTPPADLDAAQLIAWNKCVENQRYVMKCTVDERGRLVRRQTCEIPTFEYRISGGAAAQPHEFPHMVALGVAMNSGAHIGAQWIGGGALVSDRFVLTAAHVVDNYMRRPLKYALMGVVNKLDVLNGLLHFIEHTIPHPLFDYDNKLHDIALLELQERVMLSTFVRPICLPVPGQRVDPVVRDIAGWGQTAASVDVSQTLHRASVDIQSDSSECDNYNSSTMICAKGRGGRYSELSDSCPGDSGGPLMAQLRNIPCSYAVQGVVSYGPQACGHSAGVYTRVSYYLDWIVQNVWGEDWDKATASSKQGHTELITAATAETGCPPLDNPTPPADLDAAQLIAWNKCVENQRYVMKCTVDERGRLVRRDTCEMPSDRFRSGPGGVRPARPHEFTHMVTLGVAGNSDEGSTGDVHWFAGGALLSDKFVLTAAHVLVDPRGRRVRYALMGVVDKLDVLNGLLRVIVRTIPHPLYDDQYLPLLLHDIALLELDQRVTLSEFVRPICLPVPGQRVDPAVRDIAGLCRRDSQNSILYTASIDIQSDLSECQSEFESIKIHYNSSTMMCAELLRAFFGSRASCFGDSGGPLMAPLRNIPCSYAVQGVVSFGPHSGQGSRNIYTRVSPYLEWIVQNVWPHDWEKATASSKEMF